MSVQGVGAKASLAILGALGADGVGRAIALGDWNTVTAAKGIGPKTAKRVVLDLKDKAPGVMAMGSAPAVKTSESTDEVVERDIPAPTQVSSNPSAQADALSALSNLGYAPGDAVSAVAEAASSAPDAGEADLIRAALKLLAPKE